MVMHYAQTMFHWMTHNPSAAASVIFGGGILAVALYTYVYDYRLLAKRGKR
jgi:hypothetical protein